MKNILLTLIITTLPFILFGQKKMESPSDSRKIRNFLDSQSLKTDSAKFSFQNNGDLMDLEKWRFINFPIGSDDGVCFDGGFLITGYVNGQLCVSPMMSAARLESWQPGPIFDGVPQNPNDNRYRLYRYSTIKDPGFQPDFSVWPTDLGARFHDLNSNGIYEPGLNETPATFGDEMLWGVINDLADSSYQPFPLNPMSLEIHLSYFVKSGNDTLNKSVFLLYELINRNKLPIDSVIFSVWSDIDVLSPDNDLAGTDTSLQFSFAYNSLEKLEGIAQEIPATGHGILIGPMIKTGNEKDTAISVNGKMPGYRHAKIQSSFIFKRGDPLTPDPQLVPEEFVSYQKGYQIDGKLPDPLNLGIGGTAEDNPRFAFPGDPESQTGWVENKSEGVDIRNLLSTEPFFMASGDTQFVFVAYSVARGTSALNSPTVLKNQFSYLNDYASQLLSINKPSEVKTGSVTLKVTDQNDQPVNTTILLRQSGSNQSDSLWLFHAEDSEGISTSSSIGAYTIELKNISDWGYLPYKQQIPDEFQIKESVHDTIEIQIDREWGIYEPFNKIRTDYWITSVPGDVPLSISPWVLAYRDLEPEDWTFTKERTTQVINNQRKLGVYTLRSKPIDLPDTDSLNVLIRWGAYLYTSTDSLLFEMFSSETNSFQTILHFSPNTSNLPENHEWQLVSIPSNGSDSITVQFRVRKSSLSFRPFIDLFVISEKPLAPLYKLDVLVADQLGDSLESELRVFRGENTEFYGPPVTSAVQNLKLPPAEYEIVANFVKPYWGKLYKEIQKSVSIQVDQDHTLAFTVETEPGYLLDFNNSNYPLISTPLEGDATFPDSLWVIESTGGIDNSGFISIKSSQKGNASFSIPIFNGANFQNPTVSFSIKSRIASTDTLLIQISNDAGKTWIGEAIYSNLNNQTEWLTKGFYLKDYIQPSDSMILRFIRKKTGATGMTISIDNILISDNTITSISDSKDELAARLQLSGAYPNPFNPTVTIQWYQATPTETTLYVYNTLGQVIFSKQLGFASGHQQTSINFTSMASGVYFAFLKSDGFKTNPIKLVLLK